LRPVDAGAIRGRETAEVFAWWRRGGAVFEERVESQVQVGGEEQGAAVEEAGVVVIGVCRAELGEGVCAGAVAAGEFVVVAILMAGEGQEAGEFVLEGVFARGLVVGLLGVVVEPGGFFEDAGALELVAVEELGALGLGLLEGVGELFWGERRGEFRAGCANGARRPFEVEFEGAFGELVHQVGVAAHVFDCGCSRELRGGFFGDVMVGFWLDRGGV
jgi:hypothetical protein